MKILHFSFDDVCFCLDDVIRQHYASVFEQPFLRDLRAIHQQTGAVFTLLCFNRDDRLPEYDISALPETHQAELQAHKDWLRFSFHAEEFAGNYNTLPGMPASYDRWAKAMLRFTGDAACLDSFTRIHYFAGSLDNVQGVRCHPQAIRGLYAADDTRLSYYLDQPRNDQLLQEGRLDDDGLVFIRSLPRLDSHTAEETIALMKNYAQPLTEVFMHEPTYRSQPETYRARIETIARWAGENGYRHAFHSDEVTA